jgi:hypothetical protein
MDTGDAPPEKRARVTTGENVLVSWLIRAMTIFMARNLRG